MARETNCRIQIRGPDTSETFMLPVGETIIGRQSSSGIWLQHGMVSRQHARIDRSADICQITDLESANGTKVNGEQLKPFVPTTLRPGSVIKIGPFVLNYEQESVQIEDRETPAPPVEPVAETVWTARSPSQPRPESLVPPPAGPTPPAEPEPAYKGNGQIPPGLSTESLRLIHYLPGIYHTHFMSRFLALIESILLPIEWNIANFDLYLDPRTAPVEFLPWLANWFEITFDDSWNEAQRRALLVDAHQIFARRGTRWGLGRVLEIYSGKTPEIIDEENGLDPFTFEVRLPIRKQDANRQLIEAIIDANKPAHTAYRLKFIGG